MPPATLSPTACANDSATTEFVCRRNCSIGPAALAAVFGSMVGLAFVFGIAFAVHGPWLILPFAGLELCAVGAAFFMCARHAGDFERVSVSPRRVVVETGSGARRTTHEFNPQWARLAVERSPWSIRLLLVQSGRAVELGRHLGWERRAEFAAAFGTALRGAGGR